MDYTNTKSKLCIEILKCSLHKSEIECRDALNIILICKNQSHKLHPFLYFNNNVHATIINMYAHVLFSHNNGFENYKTVFSAMTTNIEWSYMYTNYS